MVVQVIGRPSNLGAVVKAQPTITDVDSSTVDGTYGAEEQAVIGSLRTKVNSILSQLEAQKIFASS